MSSSETDRVRERTRRGTHVDKTLSMKEAVGRYVEDGMTVALEGFSHLIPFAAAHEIIRQAERTSPSAG